MGWHPFRDQRRRAILAEEFPPDWRQILAAHWAHWPLLDDDERGELEPMVQVFVAEKVWTGCAGFEIDTEHKVLVAAQACLLTLGLDHELYRNVREILIYPTTVVTGQHTMAAAGGMAIVGGELPILGEALDGGPVLLVWDAVALGARHPERGSNVVYHEFAHKLDMLDGTIDGTPSLPDRAAHTRWVEVCTAEYEDLQARADRGAPTLLDPYGATNVGEFFAVATETFFGRPGAMQTTHASLYEVLAAFYGQDPAAREARRHRPDGRTNHPRQHSP